MSTTENDQLLHRYLQELGEFVPTRYGADGVALPPRARAGEGTRETFRQARKGYLDSLSVWDALRAMPLDRVWAWSDLHLGHANILRFTHRPMAHVELMNEQLLTAAQVVPEDDFLLFGGDMMVKRYDELAEWLALCPARKVLILGNHDKGLAAKQWKALGFEAVAPCLAHTLSVPARSPLVNGPLARLWWTHYPMDAQRLPPGTLNIHGHVHDAWMNGARLNLSVERHDYKPQRLVDLLALPRPNDAIGVDPHENMGTQKRS